MLSDFSNLFSISVLCRSASQRAFQRGWLKECFTFLGIDFYHGGSPSKVSSVCSLERFVDLISRQSLLLNFLHVGQSTWLTPLIQPPLPIQLHSIHSKDILNGISGSIQAAAAWLMRAGVDVLARDVDGNTFLHSAGYSGLTSIAETVLSIMSNE